ncbi:MAG: hypothetical protein LBH25_09610 [Fibromonadaceae bacterium]|nr:hypothetical protein [Fibromonadaceae bacterium]
MKKNPRGNDSRSGPDENLGMGDNIIEYDHETERLVFIVYQKTPEGILAAKVSGGFAESEEILPISEYPVIRIAADESWLNDKKTFRGLYCKAQGMSDLIDATFSRVIGNIMTQPRMKYWVSATLAQSEDFRKQMLELHETDTAYAFYQDKDEQGNPIPPPVRDDGRIFADELVGITDKIIQYINMLFGFEASENADSGNKTAQEILFRKENQNANYSQYLFSLSAAMQSVCRIYESIGLGKVSIVSGPYENIYRQTSQQTIIAINDYCTAQPQRALIADLIIDFSPLDELTKGKLKQAIQQQAGMQQIMQQAQQAQGQMQQLQGQNQQLMQTVQALQNQQLNNERALSADMQIEHMKYADKAAERENEALENEKNRAMKLFELELDNPLAMSPPPPAVIAATDLNPST